MHDVDIAVDHRSMRADQEIYTHGHAESVLRSHTSRTVANSAAYLIPHLRPDLHLLDVGSGPGTITMDFARRLPEGRVVGIDPGEEIVARTQAEASAQGLGNLEFRTGDNPFKDKKTEISEHQAERRRKVAQFDKKPDFKPGKKREKR